MDFSCTLYEGAEWCTKSGGFGEGWNSFWGGFNGFKRKGMNARKACCGCGGGKKNPKKFDKTLPRYNGVSAYPFEKVGYVFIKMHLEITQGRRIKLNIFKFRLSMKRLE